MNNKRMFILMKPVCFSFILSVFLLGKGLDASAQAVNFPIREMSNKLYGTSLSSSVPNEITVSNDQRSNMLASPTTFDNTVKYKSNNTIVKLAIDHAAAIVPTSAYLYKMAYTIEGATSMSSTSYTFTANDTLLIAYNPDSLTAYQDIQIKVYPQLFDAKVTITGFYDITSGTPVSLSMPPPNTNFFVELAMQYQPFLKTHYLPGDMTLNTSHSYDATQQLLNISWAPSTTPLFLGKVTPAQYELEWTYVDNYAPDGSSLSSSAVNYNFKNNATRIITDSLSYSLPVVYPKGYLVYRVRMIRVDQDVYKYPIYGLWSLSNVSGTISSLSSSKYYQISTPHSGDSLNWNYTIHFAEGGKYKHVMGYFDGMLKNRQTITRFNSHPNRLLATESIYDFEGRPSITTLPTVINTNRFAYQPGVSISSVTGLPYSPHDFDLKPALCPDEVIIPPFADYSLANRYYSRLNTDTDGVQKFVPQAEGYPFVHTQLSTGFSDRVDAMGGAGTVLQINKGHDTKNEYLQADQPDLNNHFGINAGLSSFYTKTVSKDPNGQNSFVVKDYEGKQIMTSLFGAAVDTTKVAIIFNDEVPLAANFKENKLANPATNITVGSEKRYSGSFYMDYDALSNIKYEYAFKPFSVCPAPAYLGLTVKCSYEYNVRDNCGVEVLYKSGVLGITGVSTSSTAAPFSEDTTISLKKGKYTIEKTLTIAQEDVVAAVDSFFNRTPNCLKTENDFIREAVEKTKYPCPSTNPCDLLKQKMMEELFTDAKYGKWRTGTAMVPVFGGSNDPDINSIYDIPQYVGPGITPWHRFRSFCVRDALNTLVIKKLGKTYTNIGGDTMKVFDHSTGDTTYITYEPYDSAVVVFKNEIYTGSDQYTIAEILLPLHPEYCKLLACFDDTLATRLKALPNAAMAIKYNLFHLDSIVMQDVQLRTRMLAAPFSKTHIADSLRLLLNGQMRMDTMASQMAFCLTDDARVFGDAKEFFRSDIINLNFPTDRVKDSYFDKLRTFYLFNREKYVIMAKTGADDKCLPCDSTERMKLIPPPLVPVIYTTDGALSFGPDGLGALFSDSAIAKIKEFLGSTKSMPADTTGSASMKDSASRVVYRADSMLCSIAVDSIMSRLTNCFSAGASTTRLKDSLLALVARGEVHEGLFFPAQVRKAIVQSGLSLSDLCHPYLVNYDYYDEGTGGKGNCNAPTFYSAATDFFNEPAINSPIKAATTAFSVSTPTWPSANFLAIKIAAGITGGSGSIKMGVQYINNDSVYVCSFFKTGSDTVKVSFICPKNIRRSGVVIPFLSVASTDSIIFKDMSCFFDDPTAYAEGHVGRYMFRATIERSETISGSVVKNLGQFLCWNNGKVTMNEDGANQLAACVPCTQFKSQFKAFADSMTAYGGFAQDHPLFYLSLRNFMNYNMKKVFSQDQYGRFLVSCALADSMLIPTYGGYGRINFPTSTGPSYANLDAFKDAIATSMGISVAAMIEYKTGSTETAVLDYYSIPYKKLKVFSDALVASGGTIKPAPTTGVVGQLWLPDASDAADFIAGTSFSLSSPTSVQVRPSPYLPDWEDFKLYNVLATSPTYQQLSVGSASVAQAIFDSGLLAFWLPKYFATINKDYNKSKKQEFLQYTYSMQSLPTTKVLDTLQDYFVQQHVSAFSGTSVSYLNPANRYRFTDLYYTDSLSRYPGYDTVAHVLAFASSYLGGNKIFIPTSTNKVNVFGGTGTGNNLIMYRCADGLYWYRYFGAGSKLFNIFIRVPGYLFQSQHPSFNLVRIMPSVGDTATTSFTAAITIPGSNDTFYANGTTNFDVAWTLKLKDVLLGNEKNFSKNDDPPASGEVGAEPNCEQKLLSNDIYNGKINYYNYITKYREDLLAAFSEHVMKQVGEKLWIEYVDMRFGTTLYSYDRANNLIQTVPPEGIKKIDSATATIIDSLREENLRTVASVPKHNKSTRYEYNTANRPWKENTPDAGTKVMYYDLKGNVILSQSARQRKYNTAHDDIGTFYTYFLYDAQNRLTETGEVKWTDSCAYFDPTPLYFKQGPLYIKNAKPFDCACENEIDSVWEYCGPNSTDFYDDAAFNAQIRTKPRTQVVYTVYDSAFINLASKRNMSGQENLRSRIGANMYYESCPPGLPALNYDHATHYSYDAAGNVKTLTQDFPQLEGMKQRYKRVDYEYDLLSGKVNMISYNRGYADQFFQRYYYDADNRLTRAETSHDGFIWKRDAEYSYYQHGPLARTSIGDQRVQGVDYAYTLQGWLKSINGDLNDSLSDIGGDGRRSTITPRDAYSSTIDYFVGDYKPIGYTPLSRLEASTKSIYNGNIARQSNDVAPFGGLTTAYTYDQMNRIRRANYAQTKRDTVLQFNNWYASAYRYDMDGNIKELVRKEASGLTMDSLTYAYSSPGQTNKLSEIMDYATFSNPAIEDIHYSPTLGYPRITYDEDGFTTSDIISSNLEQAKWNIYGKATLLYAGHGSSGGPRLNKLFFGYDALGHRTYKTNEYGDSGSRVKHSTFYVREASGNILAEYNTRVVYDSGRYIRVFPLIRSLYTGATLKHSWLTALSSLGYLTDAAFADYIIARVGDTASYATGYYLANDASLTQQFVGGSFGAMRAMCDYSAATGVYPVADAIRESFGASNPSATLLDMSSSLFGNPDGAMRSHALLQLAQQVPDIYTQIAQQNQLNVADASDSAMLFSIMYNTSPSYYGTELFALYQQDPVLINNWLNAATSDTNYHTGGWFNSSGYANLLESSVLQYGDGAAIRSATDHGTDKSYEGVYGFASWWASGKMILDSIVGSQQVLDRVAYYDDPVAYLTGLTSYDYIDTALSLIRDLDIIGLADIVHVDLVSSAASLVWDVPLLSQEISLGNHHLYGSSRIGIHNYWPGQYRNTWDFKTGLADTTRLGIPVPWYSHAYNDVIDSNKTEASTSGVYNGLVHTTIAQHLLGQKQYEVTNHLGNVMVTLSDKRYVKTTTGSARDYFNASIVAAYDYYPYGMLMPERFVSDTATHCVTTTQLQMVPVKTITSVLSTATAVSYPGSTTFGGTTISFGGGGEATIFGQTGGLQIDIPVTAGVPIDIATRITYLYGSFLMVSISEVSSSGFKILSSTNTNYPTTITQSITPSTTSIRLNATIMSSYATAPIGGLFTVDAAGYEKVTYEPQNVLVTLCNKASDKYEFGFNTQMKMNEVAGIGNWNTAEFWEYNTRTGRRANLDPVTHPWESRYSVLGSNPIANNDVKGDDYYKGKDGKTHYEVGKLSRQEMKDHNYIKHYGSKISGRDKKGQRVTGDEKGNIETEIAGITVRPQSVVDAQKQARQNAKEVWLWKAVHDGGYGPPRWTQPVTFSFNGGGAIGHGGFASLNLTIAPDDGIGLNMTVGGSTGGALPGTSGSMTFYRPSKVGTILKYNDLMGWGDQFSGALTLVNGGYGRGYRGFSGYTVAQGINAVNSNVNYQSYSIGINTPSVGATYNYGYTFDILSYSSNGLSWFGKR